MKKIISKILAGLMTATPVIAMAHPGHGHDNPLSPGHYLANPQHAIPIALTLAAVAALAIWQWKKATSKK